MAPIWLPLATALIAALSALGGVILNSYLSRRDKALELAFRATQESKDFLISRGEDLYVHLDEMDGYVAAHCRLIQKFCNAHMSFDDYRRLRRESWADREKFSVSRIKLLVRSFFPALVPLHEELAENLARLNEIDRALMDEKDHDARLLHRANADAIRLQKLVATGGERLRAALAQQLNDAFRSKASLPGGAA